MYLVIVVFLDLKRAFETVDREKLLTKLKKYGIRNNELNWIRSFLTNRKQATKFKNHTSKELLVPIGLPQGTQLSVILFILYINDLAMIPKHADDTTLTIMGKNLDTEIEHMNSDLKKVCKWLNSNKLSLNVHKTKWMLLGKNNDKVDPQNIKIGDQEIERVKKIKYLGIIINDKLEIGDQIEICVKRTAQSVNFLRRI